MNPDLLEASVRAAGYPDEARLLAARIRDLGLPLLVGDLLVELDKSGELRATIEERLVATEHGPARSVTQRSTPSSRSPVRAVRIDDELWARLQTEAQRRRWSVGRVVREAVENFLGGGGK
jgi:hypothetical protein